LIGERHARGCPAGADVDRRPSRSRAWLFLLLLAIFFEVYSRIDFGATFIFSTFNMQSIAVFTVAPLLLALGQTFVIIAGGIDLSGFL
jgi:ribose transport system permease protein